jgi:hypothetical protein
MARGCWTAVLVVVVIVIGLAAVVGPTVYREGRAIAGPIAQMARSEGELEDLDSEFPFTPPEGDAVVTEQRLLEFLAVRRELKPLYLSWQDTVETVERQHGESFAGAKPVLAATRDVMTGQIVALRNARMSPSEFQWLEDVVYDRWQSAQGDADPVARRAVIRQLTEDDLEFVSALERRHGSGAALTQLRDRLEERLATTTAATPVSAAGIAPATQDVLWRHRDVIDQLDLARHELHSVLSRRERTAITIGDRRLEFDD